MSTQPRYVNSRSQTIRRVAALQATGFLLIIALVWLDEMLHVPALILHVEPTLGDWRESAVESVIVLVIAFITLRWTHQLLQRIRYLEGFIRMCSWCRKVQLKDEWIPVEEYLSREFDTATTHGICEHCANAHFSGLVDNKIRNAAGARPKGTKTA